MGSTSPPRASRRRRERPPAATRKASDVMASALAVVTPWESVTDAAQLMRDRGVGFLPVVDHRSYMRLEGVITDRDILVRHLAEGHSNHCLVASHMTVGDLVFVPAEADLTQVARLMRREQVRQVVVTSGQRVVGVISRADLALGPLAARDVADVMPDVSADDRA